jgi:hypothetical protein
MRKFIFYLAFIFISPVLIAQAFEDKIDYSKKNQPCLVINYSYPPEAVENAIISKMYKLGYKGKEEKGLFNKDKGFRVYNSTLIADISDTRYDYILKVERKSRKDDEASVVYFLIQKDDNNMLTQLTPDELSKAKSFLYDMKPDIEVANLELQILAQEETVSKAEKKLQNLQSDKEDMEKRVKKLQEDLQQNEKDQVYQQAEIENQKKALEALRAKRKN